MEKFALVIDTEGYSNKSSYNIGYTVLNLESLEILKQESIAIMPYLWDNLEEKLKRSPDNPDNIQLSKMYLNNAKDILKDSGKKYKLIRSEIGLFKHFSILFKKYSITEFFAFNVAFDKGAMKRSLTPYHYDLLFKNINFHDIQTAVFYTFCFNLDYVKFCVANNYLTKKGYCQCKAETFYRYLSKKTDFIEEHTALSDALIETEMLVKALKENPDVNTKITRPYLLLDKLYNKDDLETISNFIEEYCSEYIFE